MDCKSAASILRHLGECIKLGLIVPAKELTEDAEYLADFKDGISRVLWHIAEQLEQE